MQINTVDSVLNGREMDQRCAEIFVLGVVLLSSAGSYAYVSASASRIAYECTLDVRSPSGCHYARCHAKTYGSSTLFVSRTVRTDSSVCWTSEMMAVADVTYRSTEDSEWAYGAIAQRGCPPGERVSPSSGRCGLRPLYPDAFDSEAGESRDTCGTDVERCACGAWIDSRPRPCITCRNEYRVLSADAFQVDSSWRLVASRSRSTNAFVSSPFAKLLWQCDRIVEQGHSTSNVVAMKRAHARLTAGMQSMHTLASIFEEIGVISSYGCESVVNVAAVGTASHVVPIAWEPTLPSDAQVLQALRLVGASSESVSLGREALKALRASTVDRRCTPDQVDRLLAQSVLRPVFGAATESVSRNDLIKVMRTKTLRRFACALNATRSSELRPESSTFAASALSTLAATCVASLTASAMGTRSRRGDEENSGARSSNLTVVGFGRLAHRRADLHDDEPSDREAAHAAATTLAALETTSLSHGGRDVCVDVVRYLSPMHAERAAFETFVLHSKVRIEDLVEKMRLSVAAVLSTPAVSELLLHPNRVRDAVLSAPVVVPGAERPLHDESLGAFSSDDGPVAQMLSSARETKRSFAKFQPDEAMSRCKAAATFDALETNAYYSAGRNCVFLALGMLRIPFMDAHYDELSASSRIGFVVAHEFAHATLTSEWYENKVRSLLSAYSASTLDEAMADFVAVLAVCRSLGLSNAWDVIVHMSQLFCARTATKHVRPSEYLPTHPEPEKGRGKMLCETLRINKAVFGVTCA